jgi:preprotein translocase subunit SecG
MLELAALQRPLGGDNAPSDRVHRPDFKPRKPMRACRTPAFTGLRRKVEMQTVVIVVHLMIVATLIAIVLLQKSEGGGLGMGGGAGFMSSRGTANLLTRATAILAVGFFATSLFLSWLASYERKPSSIIGIPASQSQPAGAATPISPPTSGGVLDTLKKADEQQQKQPEPSGPQAPRSQ